MSEEGRATCNAPTALLVSRASMDGGDHLQPDDDET